MFRRVGHAGIEDPGGVRTSARVLLPPSCGPAEAASRGGRANRYGEIYRPVLRPEQTLACVDSFWLLALGGAVRVGGSLRLKKHDPRTGDQVAAL
jgi:hypothetical protein